MFKFNWSLFNIKMGLIFMGGLLIVDTLSRQFDFAIFAAGISALLAWFTIILVPGKEWSQHLLGLITYLAIGVVLTLLAGVLTFGTWPQLVSMVVVTFLGYLMIQRGAHPFMVSWCLVYWYLLAPLLLSEKALGAVLWGHVFGAGLVIALNSWQPIWLRATRKATNKSKTTPPSPTSNPPFSFALQYASTVSLSIFAGLSLGLHWFTTDPTVIANATLNMISPSLKQTWQAAVERICLGAFGIVAGFYFGWFFPNPWVGHLVLIVCSFLAMGALYVNFGLVIGILYFLIAYSWGIMRSDLAHLIGNEKLIGEFLGVLIAIVAISILVRLQQKAGSVNNLTQENHNLSAALRAA